MPTEYNVPVRICESGRLRVIGEEPRQRGMRLRVLGGGDTVYWCVEVREKRQYGLSFAVGSEELQNWISEAGGTVDGEAETTNQVKVDEEAGFPSQ